MADSIRFILNGIPREVSGLVPTTTVLQYLRLQERLMGTKEGCAEGDCGACTVVVSDGKKRQAVNACILFLPVVDGCHVMTVEHLKKSCGEKLHPVQQAMVKCHASQCGFCTPGFVMSLAALLDNKRNPTGEDVQDAISGNLCRCTGYRPILDAAQEAARTPCDIKEGVALAVFTRKNMLKYMADGQVFYAPHTVEELSQLLAEYPRATLLAGGTDIGLWVTKQHRRLETIIYTGKVSALRAIAQTKEGLEIGAAVSYAEAFTALAEYDESMEDLLRRFASAQIRNTGTLGGNIANGSPIGDGPPPLIVLGARIVLRSSAGAREINLEDYFLAYKKQDRKPGEFLEKIIVPQKSPGALFRVYKVSKRFDEDISAVCGAFLLEMQAGKIEKARICYGGMAGTPQRAKHAETSLAGKLWTEETVKVAMSELSKDYKPLTDMRASAGYRTEVAANLLYRFFVETTQPDVETRVYRYGVR